VHLAGRGAIATPRPPQVISRQPPGASIADAKLVLTPSTPVVLLSAIRHLMRSYAQLKNFYVWKEKSLNLTISSIGQTLLLNNEKRIGQGALSREVRSAFVCP
jgi:hypothetical protein